MDRSPTTLSTSMRSETRRLAFALLALAGMAISSAPAFAESPSASQNCSAAKLVSTTKAYACYVQAGSRALRGRPSNPAACNQKLTARFAKAESGAGGACPANGDAASVDAMVSAASASTFSALLASAVTNDGQRTCVDAKSRAAGELALCLGKAGARRLVLKPDLRGRFASEYSQCFSHLLTDFAREDQDGRCLTSGDGEAVAALVFPVGGYLPGAQFPSLAFGSRYPTPRGALLLGANLRGARLTTEISSSVFDGADLSEAVLTGADAHNSYFRQANLSGAQLDFASVRNGSLSGADLSGANLFGLDGVGADFSDVTWSDTLCPDLSVSSTNGSSPESCCGHFDGAPSACSP